MCNKQPHDYLIEKVFQTYEALMTQRGLILVGDPFGGKTTALNVCIFSFSILRVQSLMLK